MKKSTRSITALALAAAILFPAAALAQRPADLPDGYPSKPVRVIVGTGASGGTDLLTRAILSKVGEKWSASFVVENMASLVGGIRAMDETRKAPANGYTIMGTSSSTYQNAMFVTKVAYDVRKEFIPTIQYAHTPLLMVVYPGVPANTLKEFIAYAKANPGKLNAANAGLGTAGHLAAELLEHMAKIDMQAVPYKGGGNAALDTVGGRTQVLFTTSVALAPFTRTGKLRILGITSPHRMPSNPDIPTIAEGGVPGYAYQGWLGAIVKAGTPMSIVRGLNRAALEVVKSPEMVSKFAADGSDPAFTTPEEFRQVVEDALGRAETLIRETGLKLEE
jgi:tripartite-type tricarboxylate transporter receptor subunit TctC